MTEQYLGKCIETTFGLDRYSSFHPHRCTRNAVVVREGGAYCKQHDPVRCKEESNRKYAEWLADNRRKRAEKDEQTTFQNVGKWIAENMPELFESVKVKCATPVE